MTTKKQKTAAMKNLRKAWAKLRSKKRARRKKR